MISRQEKDSEEDKKPDMFKKQEKLEEIFKNMPRSLKPN